MDFNKIKHFYEKGLYTKDALSLFVRNEELTALQFQEITGDMYILDDVGLNGMSLDDVKDYMQKMNKKKLYDFLESSSVQFNDRNYGVTQEDQSEMALNIMQYQIMSQIDPEAILEWHSKKEKCVPFTIEEFSTLTIMIKNFIYPRLQHMQEIKEEIYAAVNKQDVLDIVINYE